MLHLQNYLRDSSTAQLEAELGVKSKRHAKYPNLVLFKYNQIESPMGNPVVQESRGIILDESNNWAIVSHPYHKFFNLGEGHAAPIDWNSAKVLEKLDGSLMQLFHYNGEWLVASSGSPDASGTVGDFGMTFSELFWSTFHGLGYKLPTNTNNTYLFELMTPYNQVVVQHSINTLVLHGIRETLTGTEFSVNSNYWVSMFSNWGWSTVESYPINTMDDVVLAASKLDPVKSEGFIVVDGNFNRVKIKSPAYVALHRSLDGISKKALLEIVRTNEGSEILTYFPQYQSIHDELSVKYNALIDTIDNLYLMHSHIDNQKDFALAIKDTLYSGILFTIRGGKFKDARHALEGQYIDRLLSMVEAI